MKILAAQMNPTIGDLEENGNKVIAALRRAKEKKVDIVLFPELTLSGYFPDDLLLDASFIDAVERKLIEIEPETKGLFAVVGLPRRAQGEKLLYNSAAIFADGKLLGFKNKTLLPTYDIFDERRYFEPGNEQPVWDYLGLKIAVAICEDLWFGAIEETHYRINPVAGLKEKRPDLILNMSGSPYSYNRDSVRQAVFGQVARTLARPLILCNQVGANDQLIFDGHSFYLNEKGELIQIAKGFVEEDLIVDLKTHACPCPALEDPIQDLYAALVLGVQDYFHKQGFKKALIGLSGGIDSALVAAIAKDALGAENVMGISLPARYSSEGSVNDTIFLAKNLGIHLEKIAIDSIFQEYLDLLSPIQPTGETEENLQPRIRAMILMAYSNTTGALLLNAGNKSEMAMGYTTLYGDMAGALGVLHDVTKRRVYELARYVNRKEEIIPQAIIDKPPSAELRPNQKDSDTLPDYEILDTIIEEYVEKGIGAEEIGQKAGLSAEFVEEIIHKIHLAEYKRRQVPIGLRVTQKAFSRGRVVPIVQKWK